MLDTTGQPLQRGVEYYIKPAVTENGGRFTLNDRRNGTCPFYVGQEILSGPDGFPVTFAPFAEGETVVKECRDIKSRLLCPQFVCSQLRGSEAMRRAKRPKGD